MVQVIRVGLGIFGAALVVIGLFIITSGATSSAAGLSPLLIGGTILIAVVLERQRYRSEAAERSSDPAGPGGGEPAQLPTQFRPTDERFVDPTTGRVMRVYLDGRTGERRYRAESEATRG